MIGCECVIYWGDELRLGPLRLQKVDSKNNTKHKYDQSDTDQQYGQNNQSNMTSNTVRAIKAI